MDDGVVTASPQGGDRGGPTGRRTLGQRIGLWISRFRAPLGLGFIIALLLGILFRYRDVSPIWDTRWYWFLCILPTFAHPYDIMAFNCSNHPNMAFFLPLGTLARWTSLSPLLVHQIIGAAFAIPALLLYYQVLLRLKNRKVGEASDFFNVLCFAMAPVYVGNVVNLSPEVGSITYMLGFLWALLGERLWLMALFGTGMVFTKEPWIIVYGLVGLFVFFARWGRLGWDVRRLGALVWELLPLGVPGFFLLFYALMRVYAYELPLFHGAGSGDPRVMGGVASLYTFNFNTSFLLTVLTQNFVASFMWIPVALILYCQTRRLAVWAAFEVPPEGFQPHPSDDVRRARFSFVVFYATCLYALTRVIPVVNPRYLMPMIPLTLLWMALVLDDVIRNGVVRLGVMALFCVLTIASQTRTFDPISRNILGTFAFGQRELLHMTSLSQSCCGRGMDSLVYNLEFTQLIRLFDQALAQIRVSRDTVVVIHRDAYFFNAGHLTPHSYVSVMQDTGFHPRYETHDTILGSQRRLKEFYFIDLPNADSAAALAEFRERYDEKEASRVARDGYELNYYRFVRKKKKRLPIPNLQENPEETSQDGSGENPVSESP